ncbi:MULTISPECIES: TerB family tellurite resistance protein [unclassified Croceitalea]|uniref:TerB family tellurite resistance protein n=1 Tax=unclassified Croceitalea TaxID=2632280 RepID=UPI0030D6E48D
MSTYQEKLSILSEMIAFARVENTIKESEYNFLVSVSQSLGVEKYAFDELLQKRVEKQVLKSQPERIVQFHRLLLLMNIDQVQTSAEINKLHNMGLKMGLPPSAIDQVLEVMHQYPNNLVPTEVLLGIFRAHYN